MHYEPGNFVVVPNKKFISGMPTMAQAIYMNICFYTDENGECYPTRKKLADSIGIKKIDTLDKWIAYLEKSGVIKKEKRFKDGRQMSNVYRIILIPMEKGKYVTESQKKGKKNGTPPQQGGDVSPTSRGTELESRITISNHCKISEKRKFCEESKDTFSNNQDNELEKEIVFSSLVDKEPTPNPLPSAPEPKPWDQAAYIAGMRKHKSDHIRLIGWFFDEKNMHFPDKYAIRKEIARWVTDARIVASYEYGQIERTFEFVRKNFPDTWKLSTMRKYIAEKANN